MRYKVDAHTPTHIYILIRIRTRTANAVDIYVLYKWIEVDEQVTQKDLCSSFFLNIIKIVVI